MTITKISLIKPHFLDYTQIDWILAMITKLKLVSPWNRRQAPKVALISYTSSDQLLTGIPMIEYILWSTILNFLIHELLCYRSLNCCQIRSLENSLFPWFAVKTKLKFSIFLGNHRRRSCFVGCFKSCPKLCLKNVH